MNIFILFMYDIIWDVYIFFDKLYELVNNYLWYEGVYVDDYLILDKRWEVKKRFEIVKNKFLIVWYKMYNDNNDDEGVIIIWC